MKYNWWKYNERFKRALWEIKKYHKEYIEIKDKNENTNKNGWEEKEELDYEGVTNEKVFIKKEKTDLKDITNFWTYEILS